MEPEPAKATVEHENETKPDELINNKDDDIDKQPLTPPRSSSSSSASSSLSLEFAADENDLSSGPPDDPWSMLSASKPEPEPEPSTDGYDPNRIPASIFSTTNSADALNWSLASNESLFSIHMGNNNSFSQDHAILCEKSGELGRVDDWNENELTISTGGLATVIEETSTGGASRVGSFNEGPHLVTSKSSLSMPRLSDESGNSCASFAFPVLVGDGVKTAGSSRKDDVTEQRRSEEEDCNTPPRPQQGPGEQGGYWYSRLCCCCCCRPRCC